MDYSAHALRVAIREQMVQVGPFISPPHRPFELFLIGEPSA